MQVYGNNSSDHYSPWPVVVDAHSRLALDFDTREPSELSVVEAFENLPTPSLILLDKNGNIVWRHPHIGILLIWWKRRGE